MIQYGAAELPGSGMAPDFCRAHPLAEAQMDNMKRMLTYTKAAQAMITNTRLLQF